MSTPSRTASSGGSISGSVVPLKRLKIDENATDKDILTVLKMHSSVDVEPDPQEVEVELGLLIVEGRKPTTSSPKGFEEGPHM